jgi:hypothetical protein
MSGDIPQDYRDQLDLRAEIARIDRDRAESNKLRAEERKFNRDGWLLALTAMFGFLAVVAARAPEIINALLH